jgi:ribosome-binding protein aMBF1 (putative translation factor)
LYLWILKGDDMIKQKQDEFYKLVGRALQVARQQRRMSIADLSNASGEQHKTIKGIESGTAQISMHHAVWMKNILGLDLNAIIRDMEGNNGKGNTVNEGTVFRIENFI